MEAKVLTEHDWELQMVETPRGLARNPGASDVDHQAAGFLQYALEYFSEWPKPFKILVGVRIAVSLLPYETKGRARDDQIHRLCR